MSSKTLLEVPLPLTAVQIRDYLPHRYPMALVDRITHIDAWVSADADNPSLDLGQSISGYKNISINEIFLQGHFVTNPIVPGVLIVEAMAQLAGILGFILIGKRPTDGEMFLLAGTDKTRFKKSVIPGDKLEMHAILRSRKRHFYQFECRATVDGAVVATSDVLIVRQAITTI